MSFSSVASNIKRGVTNQLFHIISWISSHWVKIMNLNRCDSHVKIHGMKRLRSPEILSSLPHKLLFFPSAHPALSSMTWVSSNIHQRHLALKTPGKVKIPHIPIIQYLQHRKKKSSSIYPLSITLFSSLFCSLVYILLIHLSEYTPQNNQVTSCS